MAPLKVALDMEVKGLQLADESSGGRGAGASHSSTTEFYHANLDKVQRKLSGIHIQMYVFLDV